MKTTHIEPYTLGKTVRLADGQAGKIYHVSPGVTKDTANREPYYYRVHCENGADFTVGHSEIKA